jgi:hypothetical protein
MRENWGVATGSVNTQSHGEVKGGVHSGWSAWRLAGVRCGVLFAEPLPLLFPFLRDMRSAVCVNAGYGIEVTANNSESAANVKLGTFEDDAHFRRWWRGLAYRRFVTIRGLSLLW